MVQTRIEKDSLGEMAVPASALYGAQTARAVENFPISGWPMPREFIAALGRDQARRRRGQPRAGRLPAELAERHHRGRRGGHRGQAGRAFPRRCLPDRQRHQHQHERQRGDRQPGHPVALAGEAGRQEPGPPQRPRQHGPVVQRRDPHGHARGGRGRPSAASCCRRWRRLQEALAAKAPEFDDVVKIGRTHLMDAVPIRLGQEFTGYAAQVDARRGAARATRWTCCASWPSAARPSARASNAPEDFAARVCRRAGRAAPACRSARPPTTSPRRPPRTAAVAGRRRCKPAALSLGKIANDIRLLGSGPRCGLGELILPADAARQLASCPARSTR